MPADITIQTTDAELDYLSERSGIEFRNYGLTYQGVNAKRQFIRYHCKIAHGWRMKTARYWSEIADKFYGIKHLWYGNPHSTMEFLAAALLEGVPTYIGEPLGKDTPIFKLQFRLGRKALAAIKRGDLQAPKFDMEPAEEGWSEAVRTWSRSRN